MKRDFCSKIYRCKHIDVKMVVQPTLSGEKSIRLECASKGCPLGCAMSFRTPIELWSVNVEKLAGLLSLPCERLVKLANETAKRDGRTRVTSLAEKGR